MNRQAERFSYPTNADKLLLNCIYSDVFTVKDNCLSVFDIEHIATKDYMKKLIKTTNIVNGLPVTHIANLCYLPENINRKKKAKTLYEDAALFDKLKYIEDKYSFTEMKDLDFLYENYDLFDGDKLENRYISYLSKRFAKQKQKIFMFLDIE